MKKTWKILLIPSLAILGFFIYPNLPQAQAETNSAPHDATINCDLRSYAGENWCGTFTWANVPNGNTDVDQSGNTEEANQWWQSQREHHFQMYRVTGLNATSILYNVGSQPGSVKILGCYTHIGQLGGSGESCHTLLEANNLPANTSGWLVASNPPNFESGGPENMHRIFVVRILVTRVQLSWNVFTGNTNGRHVSIEQFAPSKTNLAAGEQFQICWQTDQVMWTTNPYGGGNNRVLIRYQNVPSGSVFNGSSISGSGQLVVDTDACANVTIGGQGTPTFILDAWGYGLYNYDGFYTSVPPPVKVSTSSYHPAQPSTPGNIVLNVGPGGGGGGTFGIHHIDCYGWPSPAATIVWQTQSGATGYEVWRSINGGSSNFLTSSYTPNGVHLQYDDTSISANNTYTYQIKAITGSGTVNSVNTDSVTVNSSNCGGSPPPPPSPTPTPSTPPTCTDSATVVFTSGLPATLTPGQNYSFTVRVTNTGQPSWYHGSAYQLRQISSYTISPSYGHMPYVMNQGDHADFTFTLTTPAYSAGTKTLTMQMMHMAGWGYAGGCNGPVANVPFNSAGNETFTITPPVPPPVDAISFAVTYTLGTLNTPTNVTFNNATCGQIAVNWSYVPNTTEQSFTVWRSTSGNPGTFTQVSGSLGIAVRSYVDTPPSPNTSYYYMVKAHTTIGGTRETQSAVAGPVVNQGCTANIGLAADVTHINGVPYSSTAVIKNGDVLTFRLVLSNSGTSAATINYFCSTPSVNLTNLASLASTAGTVSGITTDGSACPGGSARRLNVSGTKVTGNPNWVVTFNATFQSQTQDGYEICSNNFRVSYSDPSASNQSAVASYGPILCKTNKGKSPDVREVAP